MFVPWIGPLFIGFSSRHVWGVAGADSSPPPPITTLCTHKDEWSILVGLYVCAAFYQPHNNFTWTISPNICKDFAGHGGGGVPRTCSPRRSLKNDHFVWWELTVGTTLAATAQLNKWMGMDFVPNSHGRNNPPIAFADRKSISKASPIRHLGLRIRMMDEWKKGGI